MIVMSYTGHRGPDMEAWKQRAPRNMAFRHEMLTFSPRPHLEKLIIMEDVAWVISV